MGVSAGEQLRIRVMLPPGAGAETSQPAVVLPERALAVREPVTRPQEAEDSSQTPETGGAPSSSITPQPVPEQEHTTARRLRPPAGRRDPESATREALGALRAAPSAFDADCVSVAQFLVRAVDGVLVNPFDARRRRLRLSNALVAAAVVRFPAGKAVLYAAGFQDSVIGEGVQPPAPAEEPEFVVLTPQAANDSGTLLKVRAVLAEFLAALGQAAPAPPDVAVAPAELGTPAEPAAPAFDPWSASVIRMAPAAAGRQSDAVLESPAACAASPAVPGAAPSPATSSTPAAADAAGLTGLARHLLSLREERAMLLASARPASRHSRALAPRPTSSGTLVAATRVSPEELVALGLLDVSAAGSSSGTAASSASDSALIRQAAARRMRAGRAEREGPMRPRAMKDLESELASLPSDRLWLEASVRVALPSGWVVEGRFSPAETVGAVRAWLAAEALEGPAAAAAGAGASACDLFTSPPKQSLDDAATLADSGLSPVGLIRLSWGDNASGVPDCAMGERDASIRSALLAADSASPPALRSATVEAAAAARAALARADPTSGADAAAGAAAAAAAAGAAGASGAGSALRSRLFGQSSKGASAGRRVGGGPAPAPAAGRRLDGGGGSGAVSKLLKLGH